MVEDIDYGRAAAVQGGSDRPVTVADLAKAAGVELVGEDEKTDEEAAASVRPDGPRRRAARPAREPEEK